MAHLPPSDPRVTATTLPAAIARDALDRIALGQWAPGHRMTEQRLMQQYQASRAAVREAIARLSAWGAVEQRRGYGTVVLGVPVAPARPAAGDAIELLELRIGLEAEAAGLAALRRTRQDLRRLQAALKRHPRENEARRCFRFHVAVGRASHNPHYTRLVPALWRTALRMAAIHAPPGDALQAQGVIFQAILARDTAAATAAMRLYLASSWPAHGA